MKQGFLSILFAALVLACGSEQATDTPEQEQHQQVATTVEQTPVQTQESNWGDCTMKDLEFRTEQGIALAYRNGALYTGVAYSEYPTGGPYLIQTYEDGQKEGPWKIYLSNGTLQKEGITHKGVDHGLYREWYPTGQQLYEYHFDLGNKVGVWKSWYENGVQWTERHFENNALNGKVLVWDTDGTLTKEYDYVNGELTNKQLHYLDQE